MNKSTIYTWLAAVAGLIGTGIVLGHSLGNSTQSTSLWVGGLLIFFGAITLGMAIATNSSEKAQPQNGIKEDSANQSQDKTKQYNQS